MDTGGGMILHPEYDELLREAKQLREELAELIFERDELLLHVCRNIEAEYMVKVGTFEHKIYEFECQILRLRRKIELIRVRLNRQESVFPALIEQQLDAEYAEYEEKLRAQMKAISEALNRHDGNRLTEEEGAELKSLYRQAVKKLHPDLNPEQTAEQERLFSNTLAAYENGDLDALRVVCLLISEIAPPVEPMSAIDELRAKVDALKEHCAELCENIERLQDSFPYNQREFLRDERQVELRRAELENRIETLRGTYANYESTLRKMLEDIDV